MFQTEFIVWLQSYSTDFLTLFFRFITSLGNEAFIKPFVIVIIFGVNYRMGFLLLQLILVNAIATGFLKHFFALPRPFNVDSAVKLLGTGNENTFALKAMGAKTFWGLLPDGGVNYFRAHPTNSYGFPSGHTSIAMTLWGGMAVIFKKRWLTGLCIVLMILVPFSRLFLGRHFLADVLGGYLLGSILLLFFFLFVFENNILKSFLFKAYDAIAYPISKIGLLAVFCIFLPLVLIFFDVEPKRTATLLGINIGFYLVRQKGVPVIAKEIGRRFGCVVIASAFFLLLELVSKPVFKVIASNANDFATHAITALFLTLFIWLATEANVKLGWMKRELH